MCILIDGNVNIEPTAEIFGFCFVCLSKRRRNRRDTRWISIVLVPFYTHTHTQTYNFAKAHRRCFKSENREIELAAFVSFHSLTVLKYIFSLYLSILYFPPFPTFHYHFFIFTLFLYIIFIIFFYFILFLFYLCIYLLFHFIPYFYLFLLLYKNTHAFFFFLFLFNKNEI